MRPAKNCSDFDVNLLPVKKISNDPVYQHKKEREQERCVDRIRKASEKIVIDPLLQTCIANRNQIEGYQ
jgi:hypothetical protein